MAVETKTPSKRFAGAFYLCERCGALMHNKDTGECSDCERLSGFSGRGNLF